MMSRRNPTRPARTMSLRAHLADDTEKLMSSPRNPEFNSARSHAQSHPKLSPVSQPVHHHDYSAHEITNVPAPIPDTGLPPPSADTTKYAAPPFSDSQTSVTPQVSSTRSHVPSKSTFVLLPSLKTQNLTETDEEAARSSLVIDPTPTTRPVTATIAVNGPHNLTHQLNTSPSRLSTTAIIALAVSAGLTLFVVVILVKLIKRPRRRRTPTPSLPILHDGTFSHDKVESEGSPVFGGKERSSLAIQSRSAKGNTGIWTWTQYHSGIPRPTPTVTVTRSSSRDQPPTTDQATHQGSPGVADNAAATSQEPDPGQYPFIGYGNSKAISRDKSTIPLQPVQSAITRAVSRLSTVSMSLYPNSPGEHSQVVTDVGLAIDGITQNEPADTMAPKFKNRMVASRNRASLIPPGNAKDPAALRRSQSFAYGGMEPASPPAASSNGVQFSSGRARIKSTYYTPGAYPRTSAAATNHGKHGVEHEQNRILEHNKAERVDLRRGRDLTSAPGSTSPVPPSPQPTLYPDDSMSVIGEAKKVTLTGRSQKRHVPRSGSNCGSPPSGTAALGNLMMVDFAVSKSTASLVNIRPSEGTREGRGGTVGGAGVGKGGVTRKRVEDKPPRVPSPPPIPSLAQMALQQADPEGYADYHSPTYSIYGLYGGDRKSRGVSYGY